MERPADGPMIATARLSLLASVLVLAWLPSEVAGAPAGPLVTARLEYQVDTTVSGCPDARGLRAAVSSLLGRDPFRDQAPLRVRCDVDGSGGKLRAMITVTDQRLGSHTRRRLAADHISCAELVGAAALTIAIAIDPMSDRPLPSRRPAMGHRLPRRPPRARSPAGVAPEPGEAGPRPPQPTGSPSSSAAASRTPAIAPVPPPPVARAPSASHLVGASRPEAFLLALGAGLDVVANLQPGPATGIHAVVRVQRGSLGLGLEAQVNAPSQTRYRGGSVSGRLLGGVLAACRHRQQAYACGIVAAGSLSGAGEGFSDARRGLTPFAALGMRLGWQQPIGSGWSAVLEGNGLAPLVRTTLWIDRTPAWITPRIAAQASVLALRTFQ
jgi:hypothetical protein